MDHRSMENLYAVVAPGLEGVCAAELAEHGLAQIRREIGGVACSGRLEQIYLSNLHLRSASRVLIRFAAFRCRSFPDLYRNAVRLPWGRFVKSDTLLRFRVSCRRSRLMHSNRIAATLQEAADKALGRGPLPGDGAVQQVFAHLVDDQVILSMDSSGDLLHRRGYRRATTRAPLRETLAAGILMRLGWDGSVPLVDPMCGTGTFVLEAALLAAGRPPGLQRRFAFETWPGYRDGLWRRLCREAAEQQRPLRNALTGFDMQETAVAAARENLARLNVEGPISFVQQELGEQRHVRGPGLLICNPPYGKRLRVKGSLPGFYQEIGRQITANYPDWRTALVCPDPNLARATGLSLHKIADLRNGGLSVGLYCSDGQTPGRT